MKRVLTIGVTLVSLTALFLVVGWVIDTRIRAEAESEAERELRRVLPGAQDVGVSIEGTPFVFGVLRDGTIDVVRVEFTSLESNGVRLDEVSVEIGGLTLDRDQLLRTRGVEVLGIETATIDAWITADDAERLTGVPVDIADGTISARFRGRTYRGKARVSNGSVVVLLDGAPPALLPLPASDLLPCDPDVDVDDDRIHLQCTVNELPAAVAQAMAASAK